MDSVPQESGAVKPVVVRFGSREVLVNGTPLMVPSASIRTKSLRRKGSELLVLKPSPQMRGFALAFAILGGVALAVAVVGTSVRVTWQFAIPGSVLFLVGLLAWVLPRRMAFDRANGLLVERMCGLRRRSRTLSEIVAVQLIYGGRHEDAEGGSYNTYQLNLILDNELGPRLNLSNDGNRDAARKHGRQIADFLKVPLLDGLAERSLEDLQS